MQYIVISYDIYTMCGKTSFFCNLSDSSDWGWGVGAKKLFIISLLFGLTEIEALFFHQNIIKYKQSNGQWKPQLSDLNDNKTALLPATHKTGKKKNSTCPHCTFIEPCRHGIGPFNHLVHFTLKTWHHKGSMPAKIATRLHRTAIWWQFVMHLDCIWTGAILCASVTL